MCKCEKVGQGAQLFRIRFPWFWFKQVADLGPDHKNMLGARKAWQCRWCKAPYAFMLIPYKDEEKILVRAESQDWAKWDWIRLSAIADTVRWRGPRLDSWFVL